MACERLCETYRYKSKLAPENVVPLDPTGKGSATEWPSMGATKGKEGDRTVEEYRVNGFLYAIKVTPKTGAPYYLVAVDEDGNYVRSDQPNGLRIPSWKIFEW